MKTNRHCKYILSLLALVSVSTFAASFDCGKAKYPTELFICENPVVSKLDDELNALYRTVLSKADEADKKALIEQQRHWLKHTRNVCRKELCFKHAYWMRQAELTGFLEPKTPRYASDPKGLPKPPAYNPGSAVRRYDPLVLDLDGNGQIDAIASGASNAYFDLNDDGIAERSGWLGPQDGFLGLDSNGNGVIDGIGELFGSGQIDGFVELAQHDSNGDGKIDAQDADWSKLQVWQDANGDGISQTGELKSVDALGITAIGLATTPSTVAVGDNILGATGSYVRNGETGLAADIQLAVNLALTDANPNRALDLPPTLDAEVFSLPWLRGYGNVKSLPLAYQESPALREAAKALMTKDWDGIMAGFEGFLVQRSAA